MFEADIIPYESTTESSFDEHIRRAITLQFIDGRSIFEVPLNTYIELQTSTGILTFKAPPKVFLAYIGRSYDANLQIGYVTHGLQMPKLNTILFDFIDNQLVHDEAFLTRVAHEFLHDLGLSESQMPKILNPVFLTAMSSLRSFAYSLYNRIPKAYENFLECLSDINGKCEEQIKELNILAEGIYGCGFPYPPSETMFNLVYNPLTIVPYESPVF